MAKIGINIATGSLQQEEVIVGIDLGTTNSLVAIVHPESRNPVALKEHNSSSLVPSVVHIGDNGNITVGDAAVDYLITDPENTIFSAKRLMGKSYQDVRQQAGFFSYRIIDEDNDSLVKIQAGDRFYSPIDLSAFILKELKGRAEHILKTPVNKAVITVPAYFNDTQRQATRDAGKLAGLDVLRIINEPTAASLAYGLGIRKEEEKTVAVYDLGGGTFDISLLQISNGIFEVLSTNGDTYLGGDDFDLAIVRYWLEGTLVGKTEWANDPVLKARLRKAAKAAKQQLSSADIYNTEMDGIALSISRAIFEQLAAPFIERTLAACKTALSDAKLKAGNIDEVILVGGSTRVPAVRNAVAEFFGKPVNDSLNPDEVVAIGAAVQADILAGNNKDFLLLDITPLSLGVETAGGLMDVLIPRNSKIPTKAGRQYTTQKDGQSGMRISVYQGERDEVMYNRKLASFNLTGIPSMPAGLPKVDISFLINADGIMVVKAKELRSGVEQEIEVKPQFGLTDEEVEKRLLDSITHARTDIDTRALIEARTEAEQLISTTTSFLNKQQEWLTEEEVTLTREAIALLNERIRNGSKDEIQTQIETLNGISRPYAERIMDLAVQKAMTGKKIDEGL